MSDDRTTIADLVEGYFGQVVRPADVEAELYRSFQNISQVQQTWSEGIVKRTLEAAAGHDAVWQDGWTFVCRTPVVDILAFTGVRFSVQRDRIRYIRHPRPGDFCSVCVPSLSLNANLGYASVFFDPNQPSDFRIYLHPDWTKLGDIVHQLLKLGRQNDSILSFKIVATERDRGRADAIVVYCRMVDYEHVLLTCDKLVAALRPYTTSPEPLLTLRLDAGISFARQPPGQRSFGLFVSQALAAAVQLTERADRNDRLRAVFSALLNAGIDPSAVWALGDSSLQQILERAADERTYVER